MALSSPYDLGQGVLGLTARLAVYREATFWGFASVAL